MAVRGIDNQMMIMRSAELAKEAGSELKRSELMQDYLAVQNRAEAELEGTKVAEALAAQEVVIHKDKREREKGERGDAEGKNAAGTGSEPMENPLNAIMEETPPQAENDRIIDIKV